MITSVPPRAAASGRFVSAKHQRETVQAHKKVSDKLHKQAKFCYYIENINGRNAERNYSLP